MIHETRWGGQSGRTALIAFLLLCGLAAARAAELPDFYKRVDRLLWVVDDIDRSVAGWQKLGIVESAGTPRTGEGVRFAVVGFLTMTVT